MKILAGTSGYAFKEWKGNFYPADLKDDGFLGYYATKFPAVEINNTFYRLPKENVLREWAAQVPETFTFALKASQRITHHARLKEESASLVDFLLKNTATLGQFAEAAMKLPAPKWLVIRRCSTSPAMCPIRQAMVENGGGSGSGRAWS